jgi:hypothetical protein
LLDFLPRWAYNHINVEKGKYDEACFKKSFLSTSGLIYLAVTVVVTVTVNCPIMLVTGMTVNAAEVGSGAVAPAGGEEVALPLPSSVCEW